MKKFFLSLFIGIVVVFALARVYYALTDDFRLSNISYELPYNEEWQTPLPEGEQREALEGILSQKFTYLGKGAQSYAFGSQDGKYVLKFFKFKHIRPTFLINMLPPFSPFKEMKEQKINKKAGKVYGIFKSYKIAYDHDKDNTQLIYIHLNKTKDLDLSATIVDKLGLNYHLDLDDVVFILQKRGVTLRDKLALSLNQGNVAQAAIDIRAILAMYLSEYKNGIYDRDHGVPQNSGFIADVPFHLDPGKFSFGDEFKDPNFYERDITWVALKIKFWLDKSFPNDEPPLTVDMQTYLSEQFKRPVNLKASQMQLEKDLGRL